MQVVILAGGKGTRLGELTRSVPKPMVPLAGKPIIEYQIELARQCGFTQLILLTGHLGEVIENYFGDGRRWGVSIRYCRESVPLGTAGALKEIEDCLEDDFLVFYGDMVMNVDLGELARYHAAHKPLATLVVHPNNHPEESDLVEVDADGRVKAFHPKPRTGEHYYRNCANAALYVLTRGLLPFIPKGQLSDIGRDILPGVVQAGHTLWGYDTPEYIEDVGTPLRLSETERDITLGPVRSTEPQDTPRRHFSRPRRRFEPGGGPLGFGRSVGIAAGGRHGRAADQSLGISYGRGGPGPGDCPRRGERGGTAPAACQAGHAVGGGAGLHRLDR